MRGGFPTRRMHLIEGVPGTGKRTLLERADRVQPACVVVDSLSELRLLARDPLRYRRQVLGLKEFFASRGATVLILDDHSLGEDDHDPRLAGIHRESLTRRRTMLPTIFRATARCFSVHRAESRRAETRKAQ